MDNEDMLHQNKKRLVFILVLIVISCTSKKKVENETLNSIENKIDILSFSKQHFGEKAYENIHSAINDSLINWKAHQLKTYIALVLYPYQLDSIICFNEEKDKMISAILFPSETANFNDNIWYFYGTKIKNKWYFFSGPTLVIPHQQESNRFPSNFEKLHKIAVNEIFANYLKKSRKGSWEINEKFFNQLDYSKWGFFDSNGNLIDNSKITREKLDSLLLEKAVFSNWKDKDTTRL